MVRQVVWFATSYEVTLTPLPCLAHLNADQRRSHGSSGTSHGSSGTALRHQLDTLWLSLLN